MHHSSQIFDTPWESHLGTINLSSVGGSEQQSFETIRSPFNIMSPLQTSTALCGKRAWMSFHQHDPQMHIPTNFCSELPEKIDSPRPCHKSSGDNLTVTTKQVPSTSQFSFTNSLHSIVESFLSSSEESFSSYEKYSGFPSDSDEYSDFPGDRASLCGHFSQENKLLANDAAEDAKTSEISFQRHQLAFYTQSDKQCSQPCGVAGVPSSINPVSGSTQTRKRRIRWTKDLHEPFIMIVNRLGGPDKAKPKSILKFMESDVLTISHIKSHLQKYRSTICMTKDLKERSGEGKRPDGVSQLQHEIHKQIEESRQLQLDVQRSLHQQLEIQRNLELIIEEQRKKLKIMLDQRKQRSKLQVSVLK